MTQYFSATERKVLSAQNPIPMKIPFKEEGEIKTFSEGERVHLSPAGLI
jgi:hypothetical protein